MGLTKTWKPFQSRHDEGQDSVLVFTQVSTSSSTDKLVLTQTDEDGVQLGRVEMNQRDASTLLVTMLEICRYDMPEEQIDAMVRGERTHACLIDHWNGKPGDQLRSSFHCSREVAEKYAEDNPGVIAIEDLLNGSQTPVNREEGTSEIRGPNAQPD